MNRVIRRSVPDSINPFMPPPGLDPLGLRDDSHKGTGAVGTGGFRQNASMYGTIFMMTGGLLGTLAMYKGHFMGGALMMGAGLLGGAFAEGMQEKPAGA